MSSRLPPVPSDNRSPKGSGETANAKTGDQQASSPTDNPDKMGQQGNSKVNTTHQGYQQDR
ncbi:hypothetical protein ACLE20_07715 [Rhizobium sp. YIM 134829]|uniref:hypothetical protein n=1 Tax=Rhizobium sp. YIM 134829 TaxID=3390453 RepID=UPI00397D667D